MGAILSAVVSIFEFRFRGRTSLELELIALRSSGDGAAPAARQSR
jgi:hypothetical protein